MRPREAFASVFVRTNSPKARDVSVPMERSLSMPSILEVNWAPHLQEWAEKVMGENDSEAEWMRK